MIKTKRISVDLTENARIVYHQYREWGFRAEDIVCAAFRALDKSGTDTPAPEIFEAMTARTRGVFGE